MWRKAAIGCAPLLGIAMAGAIAVPAGADGPCVLVGCFLGLGAGLLYKRVVALPALPPGAGLVPDLHDGLVLVDRDGRIVDVNPAVSAMFGHHRDELVGRDLLVLVPSYGDDQVGVARWRRTSRGAMLGTIWNLDGRHADGGKFPIELSFQKVVAPNGVSFLYAMRDSAQDRLSEEAQRHKDVLLDEVRHQALQASRAKARFLANMSRELRTPLNAIIGYAEILHEDSPPPLKVDCDRILRSAQRLRHLVESVLELSRLEAGREYVFVEAFSLTAMIRRTVAELQPLAEGNGNRIEVDLHPDLDGMRSDLAKVQQILHHLIENACRFTERGQVTVRAGLSHEDAGMVLMEVSDTGVGIPLVHRDSVFEAFEVVDRSTRRLVGGAGVGLAIARGHAQLLGGALTLDERRLEGCTFLLRLPLDAGLIEDEPEDEPHDEGLLLADTGPTDVRARPDSRRKPTLLTPLGAAGLTPSPASVPTVAVAPTADRPPAAPGTGGPVADRGAPEPEEVGAPVEVDEPARPLLEPSPKGPKRRRRPILACDVEVDPIARGPRILVLDRESPLRDELERRLRAAGHRVLAVSDGRQAVCLAAALSPAAMVVNPDAPDVRELLERGSDDTRVGTVPIVFATPSGEGWFLPASATMASSASIPRFRELMSVAFVVPGGRALVLTEETAMRDAQCAMLAAAKMVVHAHHHVSGEMCGIAWDLVLVDPSLPGATTAARLRSATGPSRVVILLPSLFDDQGRTLFLEWMRAQTGSHLTGTDLVGWVRAIAPGG